jgi:hypothetical protein
VKYVFDAHTTKASKRLKGVLLHLWRINVKTTGGFICVSFGDFHIDKVANCTFVQSLNVGRHNTLNRHLNFCQD